MQIAPEHVVTITYTLTGPDGQVIDQSAEGSPLVYLHGKGMLISGLESRLETHTSGEELSVAVPAKEAYGERDPEAVIVANRGEFPAEVKLEPGTKFWAESSQGSQLVTVLEVEDDSVTLDNNHPLAGLDLTFAVKILDVRAATAEEIAHGHVHGEEGCPSDS